MTKPEELNIVKFSKKISGYDIEQVDKAFEQLKKNYEEVYKNNLELEDKLTILKHSVDHYKAMEETLKNNLATAQSTVEDMKSNALVMAEDTRNTARQTAENIIKEAELSGRKIMENVNLQLIQKNKELSDIKNEFEIYLIKMSNLISTQSKLLEQAKSENISEFNDNQNINIEKNNFDITEIL